MKLSPLPPPPAGVTYALTVPQSVLFTDLSLQGNLRTFFKLAANLDYEPEYIVIDGGGVMSWNHDQDAGFTEALLDGKSVVTGIARFINLTGLTHPPITLD